MQQTTYAQVRSRDPRNTFYGVNPGAASASPYMARPTQGADVSMYQRPAVPASLSGLVSQAEEDQNAMVNPGFQQRLMEQQNQGTPTSLQGIDIGSPAPVSANPNLSTDQGLQDAGLMPSDALPVTPPTKPLEAGPAEFTPSQVEQAQGVVNTLAQGQDAGEGMAGATRAKDQEKVNSDIMQVAKAKDPSEAWNKLQKEPFYQNSSFYTGLMGVGLSIMSGKSPIEAFQIGQGMANQDETKKQLEANRDALVEQGFSQDSIAAAIASGDPSLLKMRAKDPLQQEALYAAREDRANAEWDRRNAITAEQNEQKQAALDKRYEERLKMQQEKSKDLVDYRNKVKEDNAEKAMNSFNFTSKDINAEKNTPEGSNIKQWSTKKGYFTAADKEHNIAQNAIEKYNKSGSERDRQEATAAFKQLIFNLARGEVGENRSLQGSDLAEFAEDPSIPIRTINDVRLKSGFTPTQDALGYVKKAIDVGIDSMNYNIDNAKEARVKANAVTMGPRRATALVNRSFGSGFHDPLKVFQKEIGDLGVEQQGSHRPGALSSAEPDPSWMMQ